MKKYSKTIKSSISFLDDFKKAQSDDERYNLLIKEDVETEIESLLANYDHYLDTTGEVCGVEIIDGEINSKGIGYLSVEYQVDYYYGCTDQNTTTEEEMTIDVSLNLSSGEIILTGEDRQDRQEREPDDY